MQSWLQDAPKLKVAIVGGGLAGLSTAVELLDQGHEVDVYESRPFIGGKVASFKDKQGNHIEVPCNFFLARRAHLLHSHCGFIAGQRMSFKHGKNMLYSNRS